MKKMTLGQKTILVLMSTTALCLFALFLALIPSISDPAPGPTPIAPTPPPTGPVMPTPVERRAAGAIVQCRQFIRDRLLSPSSAKFSHEKAYKINGEPLNYHAVTGIVESPNRFGILLQSEYRCDLHYLPVAPSKWVLDYWNIND